MNATKSLPAAYRASGTLDVSKNQGLLLWLNLAGLVILVLSGWLFFQAIVWLRPKDALGEIHFVSVQSLGQIIGLVLAILGLTAVNLIIHEGIHGIFFWVFTRSMPRFAFRGAYAYAAAPGWYIPRNEFLVTTLAPLVLISLAGLVVIYLIPPAGLLATWFVITMNASGAVGDMLVAGWITRHTPLSYIQDLGDAVTLYLPGSSGDSLVEKHDK
jgi:hypothetical protein